MRSNPRLLIFALLMTATCAEGLQSGSGGGGHGEGGEGGIGETASSSGSSGAAMVCAPGKQEACTCTDGSPGAQVCSADGTAWNPCMCTGSSSTSSSSGASSSSSSSASSSSSSSASSSSSSSASSSSSGGPVDNADACPGMEIFFNNGLATVSDTTANYNNDYAAGGSCNPNPAQGREVVYRFVAPKSGMLTVTAQPSNFSGAIYYSTGTCNPNVPVTCKASITIGATVTLTTQVTQGTTYWFFLDGYSTSVSGPFTLDFSLP